MITLTLLIFKISSRIHTIFSKEGAPDVKWDQLICQNLRSAALNFSFHAASSCNISPA
jgi:hypothetical protein